MNILRNGILGGVLAAFAFAGPAAAQGPGGIVVEIGRITFDSPASVGDFVVYDTYAGSDTSWGGLNDADRGFRILGERQDGAELFLTVTYEGIGAPSLWVHLEQPGKPAGMGGSDEGMALRIDRYDFATTRDETLAIVAGRFSGPLRFDSGAETFVSGAFDVEMPRVGFSISLPDPD